MKKITIKKPDVTTKKMIRVLFFNKTTETKGETKIPIASDQDPLKIDFDKLEEVISEDLKNKILGVSMDFSFANLVIKIYAFQVLTFASVNISIEENEKETSTVISSEIESSEIYFVGGRLLERHEALFLLKDLSKLSRLPQNGQKICAIDSGQGIGVFPFSEKNIHIERNKLHLLV